MEETSNDLLHFSLFKFCKYRRRVNPWLIALRAVVRCLTSGCQSPYEQLSIAIRAVVRCLTSSCPLPCALSYKQLDNILVAIIFEGNDVKSCWDACWHYK